MVVVALFMFFMKRKKLNQKKNDGKGGQGIHHGEAEKRKKRSMQKLFAGVVPKPNVHFDL